VVVLPALVCAQTDAVEEVVVRGTRDTRDTQASGFVSRATVNDAPREVTDAASLIEPLPGVHVRRYGADDAFSTLSIRGSSSTEIAVLFAGVPLTGGADPSLDLGSLPLWPGAVVRLHRTFTPASLGPGSLGGTLALEPPKPSAPPGTEAWGGIGSFGEARLRVGDVRAVGDARVVTAISASRADDEFTYLDPIASSPGHDVYATRKNAGHAAADGLVSWALPVRWSSESTGTLTVTALAQARDQDLPGTVLGPTPFARLDSDRELASARITGAAGSGTWSALGWGRRERSTLSDAAASAAIGPTHADQTISAAGGSIGFRGAAASSATIEAHLDGSAEHFEPGLVTGAPLPPQASRVSGGAALDADWRASEHLVVALSGRIDGFTNSSAGTTIQKALPTGHVGAEATFDVVTITAHAGATARPPSFVELYGDRGAFIGDPSLVPESAWTVDAGTRSSRSFGRVTVAAEVDGFATWADDLITFVPEGAYGRAKATNIGVARLLGIEADARVRAGPIEARGAYTGMLTENDSACEPAIGPCVHPALPGRPANDVVADLIGYFGPASVRVGIDAVTGMVADVSGGIGVPARVLASTGARVDVARGVRVALDVRNLFDQRTGTYAGALGPVHEPIGDYYAYPLPGRSFLVSARFER
jgi:outer membrane receptor protein involved in Fe transport